MELGRGHPFLRMKANECLVECIAAMHKGQTEEAITRLSLHDRGFPSTPGEAAHALTCRGLIRMIERRLPEAVDHLREAIRLAPYLAAPRVALSHALLLEGRFEEAFAAYQEAIRIDSEEGRDAYPRVRDLYLPLVLAFEQVGRAGELFAVYTDALFPDEPSSSSFPKLPNPVEVFLDRQPDKRRYACLQIIREFILGEAVYVLGRGGELEIPDMVTLCTFLSMAAADLGLFLSLYSGTLLECDFSDRTRRRRLNVARSFLLLCHELGYIKASENDPDRPQWLTARQ